jgi:Na+:H+ antiporter, NhaA family
LSGHELGNTGKDFDDYVHLESYSAILLLVSALIALVLNNTHWRVYYEQLLYSNVNVDIGFIHFHAHTIWSWINDGLMAFFFLLVGLEMKREMCEGELKAISQVMLPLIGAIGGMVIPAAVFLCVNLSHPVNLDGWAIPVATDIAFSLGILALLGSRMPTSLKVFLTALAIFDDMGAVLIIAIFHTHDIKQIFLLLSLLVYMVMWIVNRLDVDKVWVYLLLGAVLWVCVFQSGIHPTLAGIATAFVVPLKSNKKLNHSPLKTLEHNLHLWVAFGVLPIFAFANAGVSFSGLSWGQLLNPLTLGIALGLFLGKQIGVMGASYLTIRLGLAKRPKGMSNMNLYGLSLLAGMGFTMSLFIGSLAFTDPLKELEPQIRIGVLAGSFLSGVIGYLVLLYSNKGPKVMRLSCNE